MLIESILISTNINNVTPADWCLIIMNISALSECIVLFKQLEDASFETINFILKSLIE